MINLKINPFSLDDEAISWVQDSLDGMTLTQSQLFCPVSFTTDENALKQLAGELGIGGMMPSRARQ